MNPVDILSDTVYRDQATRNLDRMFKEWQRIPVARTQLYGLREIARNQPSEVAKYARHQRHRAEAKGPMHQDETDFWRLVHDICERPAPDWSVAGEGRAHLPSELQDESLPVQRKGMSHEERRCRNRLKVEQRNWLHKWKMAHVPAFFQRFCAHALYLRAKSDNR